MNFNAFVSAGWRDHAKDSAAVGARMEQGLPLVQSPQDVVKFSGLIVHVLGEHLGHWDVGVALLKRVGDLAASTDGEARASVFRGQATLLFAKGDRGEAEKLAARAHIGPWPETGTKARVLAVAASALAGQKRVAEAAALFDEALSAAAYGPNKDDPAARALAVTGNNLAVELESLATRSPDEVLLMKRAALAARKFWEVTGGWLEVERAEYRMAMTMVAAAEPQAGLEHADECLNICLKNGAGLFEQFFAHEARSQCLHAAGRVSDAKAARDDANRAVASMKESVEYLTEELKKLDAILGG